MEAWLGLPRVGMICALLEAGSVNLTQWLPYIPCQGKYAQSQQRRLQRWLHNSRINIHRLYQPLITAALSTWQEPNLIKAVKEELRWHYRIRLKKDCWIWAGLRCGQLKDYHFGAGEALCLQNVRLYKDQPSELVNVIIGRNNVNGEFWAVVSDETTTLQTYAEYGLRFDIEENFLDDQSQGWNVQGSQIRSVCAVSRLFFLLAVTTLYVTAQGVEVVSSGKRRWVDPHWFRGNSYFRIGWQWVKSAPQRGWQLIKNVFLTSHIDPHPARASRRQYQQQCDRLEFQLQSYDYAPT